MTVYVPESFTDDERRRLAPHFSNLDGPVFALVGLPEVVKGALFARYSRSAKSLRRLFLDEFADDIGNGAGPSLADSGAAAALYERVFVEYGDDSVAQLGGVHLACEQASNVLTKVLEWGRLMSYLEQSTRYVPYDSRLGGRYRFYRDTEILSGTLGTRYVGDMDRLFDSYSRVLHRLVEVVRQQVPKDPADSDFVYRQATRAKALDAARGMLPAAALSNVGIYGSGQGYEALLLRMRSHPLPEARSYADLMLLELRKVIPSFLRRVDIPDRGGEWSSYLASTNSDTARLVDDLLGHLEPESSPEVRLVDFDPAAEIKLIAALCYRHSDLPEKQLLDVVGRMSAEDRAALLRAYVGERRNRRHRPGRAFERVDYRFDVLGDYGAFRDLQRHRLLTIEWQRLTPDHGYVVPELIVEAGCEDDFVESMERSGELYRALRHAHPAQASYAVTMAHRIRYVMQFNAREAMHLLELRSAPQGHPSYRRVVLEMHRLIADQAGHRAIAATMSHVSTEAPALERLEAERRLQRRTAGTDGRSSADATG